jgi:hypothetical protein
MASDIEIKIYDSDTSIPLTLDERIEDRRIWKPKVNGNVLDWELSASTEKPDAITIPPQTEIDQIKGDVEDLDGRVLYVDSEGYICLKEGE